MANTLPSPGSEADQGTHTDSEHEIPDDPGFRRAMHSALDEILALPHHGDLPHPVWMITVQVLVQGRRAGRGIVDSNEGG